MVHCFEQNLPNGASLLARKLTENLIIDCYERNGLEDNILDSGSNYLGLKKLIAKITSDGVFRIIKRDSETMLIIKKFGDIAAHGRSNVIKKKQLLELSTDFNLLLESLLNITPKNS